jgi:hypothetical protein
VLSPGVGLLTRRRFVGAGAGFAGLLIAPSAWARSSAATARKTLVRSHFKPIVGAKLKMTGGGNDVDVVLSEITDLVPRLRPDDPNRFALVFTAPRDHRPTSGIRTLQHDAFGQVALFVSPVDRGVKAHHYEAVINRSRS